VADLDSKGEEKSVGVYAPFMGIGSSTGSVIDGFVSQNSGFTFTYLTSSALIFVGLLIALKTFDKDQKTRSQRETSLGVIDLLENLPTQRRKEKRV